MRPTILYPDPMLAAVAIVRSLLSSREEPEASGVTVGTRVPRSGAPPLPFVLVRSDGNVSGANQAEERASIRLSIWHRSEEEGIALASLARALLLAYPGGPDVRSFGRLTGPIPSEDPETGAPLSYFTVAARLRPTTL